jgi:sortase A
MRIRVLLEPPARRRTRRKRGIDWLRRGLLSMGVLALGLAGYVWVDAHLYQRYEEWKFDRGATIVPPQPEQATPPEVPSPKPVDPDPSTIGRIEIPRLRLRAIVREGVDDGTLRRAVGHVPGTARPGEDGNVAFAAHRDTFFRALRDIRRDDRIVMETYDSRYEYIVDSLQIVSPTDVSVLKPTKDPELTLITCYPFYYIGHAPRRFIVRARQVSVEARNREPSAGS